MYTEGTAQYTNTLAGMLRINDANLSDVEFSDIIQPTQFMRALPFVPASRGNYHSWTVETEAPSYAFRELNAGVNNTAGKEKTVTGALKLLDASFERDKASILSPKMTFDQYMSREGMKSLNASLCGIEKQLILGTANKETGFDGLPNILDIWSNMGIDVEGAGGTRVYMLCLGVDGIAGIVGGASIGKEGNIDMSDPYDVAAVDDKNKRYGAKRVDITGWMGLQIAGAYSGAVAFNIDGASGKTLDDDLIAELYSKFPSQYKENVNCILMSGIGLKQLRDSMVTDLVPSPTFQTNWGGAGRPIPIIVSDAIDDAESTEVS